MIMWNPRNQLKTWHDRKNAPQNHAQLTHLAPQDNAFDCSKPQSIKSDEPPNAPPLHNADSYYQYLDRALADPHVFNIALAGHFGSGKSTILRTYEKHYARKRRFLNISLATFGTDVPDIEQGKKSTSGDGEERLSDNDLAASEPSSRQSNKRNAARTRRQNHLIEHSILQQLFYQVPKNRIPRSRFKRISKPGAFLPWAVFLFWLLCVGSAAALFKPEIFSNARIVHSVITAKTGPVNALLTIGALFAVALPAVVAFHRLRSVTLRKLNLKSCEIEIAEEKDPSALNKHLDEILYFFEATDFDVVVLEDLDRFKTTDVFTKLREINTLVNRNIQARDRDWWRFRSRTPRRVVFIYAIKDDMFTGEERTKFFDLVIPVIPVVNHTNSRELLTQALHARGFTDIGDKLVNDIAIFVRDMRLLHNTVNEYTVYRRRLNMDGLDPEKLFAMILYKNICPEDYAKLHDSNGELHVCIRSKPALVEKATAELRAKQLHLRERIDAVDSEQLRSVQELRRLYILELQWMWMRQNNRLYDVVLNGQVYSWDNLAEDEPFQLLIETNGQIQSRQGYVANLNFSEAEKTMDPQYTYAERKDLILSRSGKKREQIEQKNAELEDRIRELRRAKLATLLGIVGQDAFPTGTLPVIKVLLRKGYIDETTYLSYLSYFYEGSLNNSDWVFVQGIKQGQEFEPDYALGNVEEIVERNLDSEERVNQACKNIHIFHYMTTRRQDDFAGVAERLMRDYDNAVELVMLYLGDGTHSPAYVIQLLHRHWPEFWQTVMDYSDLISSEWKRYVQSVILHLSAENLKIVLARTPLQQQVSGEPRFVQVLLDLENTDRAVAFLDVVRPRFIELSEMDAGSDVTRHIYESGFYAVTGHNIALMHRLFLGKLPDALPPTITSLGERGDSPLAQHVNENLEAYVSALVNAEDALLREAEPTVVSLLNSEQLSDETIAMLCDGCCEPVERLESVESKELWADLLRNRAVRVTWENALAYHHECAKDELDDILIDYLSAPVVAAELSRQTYSFPYIGNSETNGTIMGQILANDAVPTSSVATLLKALPDGARFPDAEAIIDAHLVVAYPWVRFSADNYEHIRTHAASSIGEYVKPNLDVFYRLGSKLTVNGKNLARIIAVHPRKNRKREIVSTVCAHGLPDELAPVAGDICKLMFDDETFAEVFEPDTLATIISTTRDRTLKIQTLTRFMNKLADDGVWQIIQTAGRPYADIAVAGKRPLLNKGKMNSNLAASLEKRGMISKAKEEDGGVRIITFCGRV